MFHTKISDGITQLSANVAPNSLLFESMWPIPHGVSLNSYIVRGEKTAIIDGFCGWDGIPETLFKLLAEIKVDLESIDYVVINHMEPDHSGWVDEFRKLRPNFQIVATERAGGLISQYMGIKDDYMKVKTGDSLPLGNGKTLQFYEIPNVHWPETMATYETESKILFPCDGFGMFGNIDADARYDKDVSAKQMDLYMSETLRYYSNIVGAFSHSTQKAVQAVRGLDIDLIAPGHGLMWRDTERIIDIYDRLTSYSKGPAKEKVTVIWGSMYGATEMAVQPLVEEMRNAGVEVAVHRVPDDHISYIIQSVWESSGVVVGMPTYEYKMFPAMYAALDEIFKKKAFNRKAFHFGSYGWSGGARKELEELVERSRCKWDFLESVEFQGRPTTQDIALICERGRELAQQVKSWVSS